MSAASQFFGGGGGGSFLVPVELLVVGGGGQGGQAQPGTPSSGGGGGGGCVKYHQTSIQSGTKYIITVGAAGNSSSIFAGSTSNTGIVSPAGGSGGPYGGTNGNPGGSAGGSGGGGGSGSPPAGVFGSGGTTTSSVGVTTITLPPLFETLITVKARSGANAAYDPAQPTQRVSGGGGGAETNAPPISFAQWFGGSGGGAGTPFSITGSSVTYAAGGTGGPSGGPGYNPSGAGASNSGNGGAGGAQIGPGFVPHELGGSGVVIIAYPDYIAAATEVTGTYDEPTRSGFRVYRFTGSGTITI